MNRKQYKQPTLIQTTHNDTHLSRSHYTIDTIYIEHMEISHKRMYENVTSRHAYAYDTIRTFGMVRMNGPSFHGSNGIIHKSTFI